MAEGSKRPSRYDEAVVAAGVDAMWPDIAETFGDDAPTDADKIERFKADLRRALQFDDDAYKVARRLDHSGWHVDHELVDALDDAGWEIHRAERAAVKAWVAAGGVKADLPAGTKVRHRSLEGHIGEIIDPTHGNSRDEGQYNVFCAALGHVREADAKRARGRKGMLTLSLVINAEEIEVVGVASTP